jgi:hypothetical protein
VKPLAQLVHWIHYRARIARVAAIDVDGEGAAFVIRHQPIDDDGQSFLAIPIMPILR